MRFRFLEVAFWLSTLLPLYAYAGYPLILILLRRFRSRPVQKGSVTPFVSLLIPAYNEAEVIAEKIENSKALDYPEDRLEIVVASDGSTDGTTEIAQRYADNSRVRVLAYEQNRGKIPTLNASIPQLRGDVVVFSDAAAMLSADSVRILMTSYADPSVGAASGLYKVVKADEANMGKSEDFYWRYETYLKILESDISSVLGAHGHLHSIRKQLYPFPPPGTINDDYVIPVAVLKHGYRAVYEPRAVVYEKAQEMEGFGRRVRIMAGNVQQLREIKTLLTPLQPLPLFFFLSHKASRLVVPFAILVSLITCAALAATGSRFYTALLVLQGLFYALAAAGWAIPLYPKTLRLPYYFCMINTATFLGAYHALTDLRKVSWK